MSLGEAHARRAGPCRNRLAAYPTGHSILPGARQPGTHLGGRVCEAGPALQQASKSLQCIGDTHVQHLLPC